MTKPVVISRAGYEFLLAEIHAVHALIDEVLPHVPGLTMSQRVGQLRDAFDKLVAYGAACDCFYKQGEH